MSWTVPTGRKLQSIHKHANLALSQHIQASEQAASSTDGNTDYCEISVETEESDIITDDGGEKYFALVSVLLTRPTCHEVKIKGPERDAKPQAVKDTEALRRAYQLEGVGGVKRVTKLLEKKRWLKSEIENADESTLEGLISVPKPNVAVTAKPDKLIPPGEGWRRFNDEMLWDHRSKVYFVETGPRRGQYLMDGPTTGSFREVDAAHVSVEQPIAARAGGASVVRKGAKMERTIILAELPKVARLALKFPLSFVDTPASAFALFQGVRSAEAADWCAKNFHTRLIPRLATKIHVWETKELQDLLGDVLKELDAELLKCSHAYSASSAAVALLLGDRLVVSGIGQVRALLLFEDGSTRQLLTCLGSPLSDRERVEGARGIIHKGLVHRSVEDLGEAERILRARHVFDVLQLESGQPTDEKQLRTAYRKLALRVHPDKCGDDADKEAYNKAFARLDSAKDAIEALLGVDAEICRELHRVLRFEVHVRASAAELLGVDATATTDADHLMEEAEKACRWQIKKLEKMEGVADDYAHAVAMCKEAVETIRRPNSAEALPRQEALLRVGLPSTRALGARDLKFPSPIVVMEPQSASWLVSSRCRLAILCGATAELEDKTLVSSTAKLKRLPKASALRWCLDTDPSVSSVGAVCIAFDRTDKKKEENGPAAKRQKVGLGGQQKAGTIFLRHILLRHQQLRMADPMARRDASRGLAEAEAKALETLEKLLVSPALFGKLCRELSDCTSADQPGQLAGHLGWVGRGEQEAALEEVVFALEPNEFGDVVSTNRGVHIIQRLG